MYVCMYVCGVYVWSIQKYKFCLSVTLTVAIATLLLLRSACHFFALQHHFGSFVELSSRNLGMRSFIF